MLFKIVKHILYIQIILYKGYLAKHRQKVEWWCKHEQKYKKVQLIKNKKSHGSCFPLMTHNSPQHLRLFSTMRNEVKAFRFSWFSHLLWQVLILSRILRQKFGQKSIGGTNGERMFGSNIFFHYIWFLWWISKHTENNQHWRKQQHFESSKW